MNRGLLSLKLAHLLKSDISLVNDPMIKGAALLYPQVVLWGSQDLIKQVSEELSMGGESALYARSLSCFRSAKDDSGVASSFFLSDVLKAIDQMAAKHPEIDIAELTSLFSAFMSSFEDRPTHEIMSIFLSIKTGAHFHAHPDELKSMQALFKKKEKSFVTEHRPIVVSIPDLSMLAWKDIFELRENPYIEQYRNFLSTYHLGDGVDQSLADEINQSLWAALGYSKPTAGGSAIKRVVANIPIPIGLVPNPYALYRDFTEATRERELFNRYGWLWFVQEARSVTNESQPS